MAKRAATSLTSSFATAPRPRPARRGRAHWRPALASSSRTPWSSSNYATQAEVMEAIAEFHNIQFVDLEEVEIPKAVIELVPESVARENVVLPLSLEGNVLKIIMSDPTNFDTIEKLQFILNKDIQPVLAAHEQIVEAINRHYGQTRNRVGGLDARRVHRHRHRLHRDRGVASRQADDDDSDAPVVKLVQPDHPGSGQPAGLATSTSSRSPTASGSATGSTASWSNATAPRRLLAPHDSPASRSWARSTSPRSAGPRTAGSR